MAGLLSKYQDAVQRLAEVPGLGVDSAQQTTEKRKRFEEAKKMKKPLDSGRPR